MANILQAAKWMQEGKRVTKRNSTLCILFTNEHGVIRSLVKDHTAIPEHCFVFSAEDLLADDWELVDPQGKVPNE